MDRLKIAIVIVSPHHGNTLKIARAMADVLHAELLSPEQAAQTSLANYDLVGFGSGIYFARHDRQLLRLVDSSFSLPKRSFVFSTAGSPWLFRWYHSWLRRKLTRRGCQVLDEFNCPGWDTFGPLVLFGGLFKGRPNAADLEHARQFAMKLTQAVVANNSR